MKATQVLRASDFVFGTRNLKHGGPDSYLSMLFSLNLDRVKAGNIDTHS